MLLTLGTYRPFTRAADLLVSEEAGINTLKATDEPRITIRTDNMNMPALLACYGDNLRCQTSLILGDGVEGCGTKRRKEGIEGAISTSRRK